MMTDYRVTALAFQRLLHQWEREALAEKQRERIQSLEKYGVVLTQPLKPDTAQ